MCDEERGHCGRGMALLTPDCAPSWESITHRFIEHPYCARTHTGLRVGGTG